jgi:hypothetical protein
MDWLSTAVVDGRAELEAQHANEREVEARDMACRVAFLLEIVSAERTLERQRRNVGRPWFWRRP